MASGFPKGNPSHSSRLKAPHIKQEPVEVPLIKEEPVEVKLGPYEARSPRAPTGPPLNFHHPQRKRYNSVSITTPRLGWTFSK